MPILSDLNCLLYYISCTKSEIPLCYILFLSIYTDNYFFADMFLKLIGKKLQ